MDRRILLNSAAFVLGFTLVFSLIGLLLQTVLTNVGYTAANIFRIAGGSIIILFGALLIASVRYNIPIFLKEFRFKSKRFQSSYLTSFVFGVGFAAGWSPCVGAILGSILALAASSPGTGFALLFAYSLGIGVPFLIIGFFTAGFSNMLQRLGPFLRYFNVIAGLFLIVVGALVVTNYLSRISGLIPTPGDVGVSEQGVSILIAMIAGVLTFLSPCILPLIPAYIAYMAGTASASSQSAKTLS